MAEEESEHRTGPDERDLGSQAGESAPETLVERETADAIFGTPLTAPPTYRRGTAAGHEEGHLEDVRTGASHGMDRRDRPTDCHAAAGRTSK